MPIQDPSGHRDYSAGIRHGALQIAPSDANDLAYVCSALYVGGAGNVALVCVDGSEVPLIAVPVGTLIRDVMFRRVKSTGTTATNLVGFF